MPTIFGGKAIAGHMPFNSPSEPRGCFEYGIGRWYFNTHFRGSPHVGRQKFCRKSHAAVTHLVDQRRRAVSLVFENKQKVKITLSSARQAGVPVPRSFRFGFMPSLVCKGQELTASLESTPTTTPWKSAWQQAQEGKKGALAGMLAGTTKPEGMRQGEHVSTNSGPQGGAKGMRLGSNAHQLPKMPSQPPLFRQGGQQHPSQARLGMKSPSTQQLGGVSAAPQQLGRATAAQPIVGSIAVPGATGSVVTGNATGGYSAQQLDDRGVAAQGLPAPQNNMAESPVSEVTGEVSKEAGSVIHWFQSIPDYYWLPVIVLFSLLAGFLWARYKSQLREDLDPEYRVKANMSLRAAARGEEPTAPSMSPQRGKAPRTLAMRAGDTKKGRVRAALRGAARDEDSEGEGTFLA